MLVLEDEPGIALAVEDALKLEGYDVEVVSDGFVASLAVREGFDVILLDVMVPGQTGFEVRREGACWRETLLSTNHGNRLPSAWAVVLALHPVRRGRKVSGKS